MRFAGQDNARSSEPSGPFAIDACEPGAIGPGSWWSNVKAWRVCDTRL